MADTLCRYATQIINERNMILKRTNWVQTIELPQNTASIGEHKSNQPSFVSRTANTCLWISQSSCSPIFNITEEMSLKWTKTKKQKKQWLIGYKSVRNLNFHKSPSHNVKQ